MGQRTCHRRITVALADEREMEEIFRIRHDVYATELGQHQANPEGRLTDSLDSFNTYIVARVDGVIAGFVSITPPDRNSYSIDKYFDRDQVPANFDETLFEIRILTVSDRFRRSLTGPALAYASLKWVEACGGCQVVVLGRTELRDFYLKMGLRPSGVLADSGALTFELLTGTVPELNHAFQRLAKQYPILESEVRENVDWQLNISRPEGDAGNVACYHGGAFFEAIGPAFDHLERVERVISADVLDAWFPPSPKVSSTLRENLDWALMTSPPTNCEGLVECIARTRRIPSDSVLPGGGSSNLIFLALRHWLRSNSKALVLDPSYGEYAHVLENVIGCRVDRLRLRPEDGFAVDLAALNAKINEGYDLVVLVNPNNPTGRHIPRADLEEMLSRNASNTLFWIDEAYLDYVGRGHSLERFAAESQNVVVCKSMSKVYALSGLRVGYLCGPPRVISPLRLISPPWAVALPGQMAAVAALQDFDYYSQRYCETHFLRTALAEGLHHLGMAKVVPGTANFLMFELPEGHLTSSVAIARCRNRDLFLRDPAATTPWLGTKSLRIAVKDAATNSRMLEILEHCL